MRIPGSVVAVLARALELPLVGHALGRLAVRRLTRRLAPSPTAAPDPTGSS